nr:RNA-directed DNA polymerase, eukaryota, reverse transcriptase zinc-binding domain protein [Tanacetum cinerariifolium]
MSSGRFTYNDTTCFVVYCMRGRGKRADDVLAWALKERPMVRVELDKKGIDLDLVLCPSCNNSVETCAHSLITCDLAMSVWENVFAWWKMRIVNAFSIDEIFSSSGNVNVPIFISRVWQAVLWTSRSWEWCGGGGVGWKVGESGVKGMAGKPGSGATVPAILNVGMRSTVWVWGLYMVSPWG